MFTASFVLLAAVALASALFIFNARKKHLAQEARLTADELKTFNERFRFKNREGMPTTFMAIAATSDRFRRTSIIGILAIVASLAYVIIAGPSQ
jgi:hypothetical protein